MNKIGNVDSSVLTHKFTFGNKECLIGKFDPQDPAADLSQNTFAELGTELMDQINASGIFTVNEMENIAMLDSHTFLSLISEA